MASMKFVHAAVQDPFTFDIHQSMTCKYITCTTFTTSQTLIHDASTALCAAFFNGAIVDNIARANRKRADDDITIICASEVQDACSCTKIMLTLVCHRILWMLFWNKYVYLRPLVNAKTWTHVNTTISICTLCIYALFSTS
ncbi:unnamed protein product, partial [Urochloa humidicola]